MSNVNFVDLNEKAIVVFVPENTIKLKLIALIDDNDDNDVDDVTINDGFVVKTKTATTIYNLKDINDARQKYLELDPDDDAFYVYKLTEKGEAILNDNTR